MKEVLKKEYEGNCPICGRKQKSDYSSGVDTECYECRDKREKKEKKILMKEFDEKIKGSEIIYFDLSWHYFRVKSKDGTVFDIDVTYENGYEGSIELNFDITKQKWNGTRWVRL